VEKSGSDFSVTTRVDTIGFCEVGKKPVIEDVYDDVKDEVNEERVDVLYGIGLLAYGIKKSATSGYRAT
jgi:hypothetical protein